MTVVLHSKPSAQLFSGGNGPTRAMPKVELRELITEVPLERVCASCPWTDRRRWDTGGFEKWKCECVGRCAANVAAAVNRLNRKPLRPVSAVNPVQGLWPEEEEYLATWREGLPMCDPVQWKHEGWLARWAWERAHRPPSKAQLQRELAEELLGQVVTLYRSGAEVQAIAAELGMRPRAVANRLHAARRRGLY